MLIWSAIEFLISDPPDRMPRIEFFLQSMVPCICLNYARRYACAIFDELATHHEPIAKSITRAVSRDKGIDVHTKFARFMFHSDFSLARMNLIAALDSNPLLRNRIWKLHENFKNPQLLEKSILAHEKRVEWQISRIYRARNSLVHGGQKPLYLSPLTLNSFEYFKTVFFALVSRAEKALGKVETEYLISSILFDYEAAKSKVSKLKKSKSASFDEEVFVEFFSKS